MESLAPLVRRLRLSAGLSQRDLARRAATSQPAVARYERGAATPSWETLERLAAACGQRIRLRTEVLPEPDDVELTARGGESSVRVITIDEVIASKEELARAKDTAALPALYATREELRRRGSSTS